MSVLFEATNLGRLRLRNRFVRSATGDGLADSKGHVTFEEIEMFRNLSHGGVGLIVTGIAYVHPSGSISNHQLSIATDDCVAGLRALVDAGHEGGAAVAVQLFHAGREAAAHLRGRTPTAVGPSLVEGDAFFGEAHGVMEEEDFRMITRAFARAAIRAKEAGFDAVQLHAAHGYLFSQLLSPYTNRRRDRWGGPLENRMRFHLEVYREIRAGVGDSYPILIKLGVQDGFDGGLCLEEGTYASANLAEAGFECIEVSQGLRGKVYEETEYRTRIRQGSGEAYFRSWARAVKERVKVPVMIVGGLRTVEVMEEIVLQGDADLVSLARPLIREPDLVNRWRRGDRRGSACIS